MHTTPTPANEQNTRLLLFNKRSGPAAPDRLLDEHDDLKYDLGWLSSRTVANPNYDGRLHAAMQARF